MSTKIIVNNQFKIWIYIYYLQNIMAKTQTTQVTSTAQPKSKKLTKETKDNKTKANRHSLQAQKTPSYSHQTKSVKQYKKARASKKNVQGDEYFNEPQSSLPFESVQGMSSMINISQWVGNSAKPILSSQFHIPISEDDFMVFLDSVERSGITSIMLVNGHGQIIFSDKLAHQLFEGSLNNFKTTRIQQLFLTILRERFIDQLMDIRQFNEQTAFNWIIYSKNIKRRYSRVPFMRASSEQQSAQQFEPTNPEQEKWGIYFRFLKSLTVRVRPMKVAINNHSRIQGFWNEELIKGQNHMQCFMLEVKLCEEKPDISIDFLMQDPRLMKYIDSNNTKAQKWKVQNQKKQQLNKASEQLAKTTANTSLPGSFEPDSESLPASHQVNQSCLETEESSVIRKITYETVNLFDNEFICVFQ